MKISRWCLAPLVLSLCVGCSATLRSVTPRAENPSEKPAQAVLDKCIAAHGGDPLEVLHDINVSYDGKWGRVVRVVQPVLTDTGFRQSSEERFLVATQSLQQTHSGPEGLKYVSRNQDEVVVHYTGADGKALETANQEQSDASALVADVYTMFLLGPSFFRHRQANLSHLPPKQEDGKTYDRLLAILKPGLGFSQEDRAALWIDRESGLLFRVVFSLEGLDSTRGAEVDTTFFDHQKVGDFLWPTRFVERVRAPFRSVAHRWSLTGMDFDRGLQPADLEGTELPQKATRPAAPFL